MLRVVLYQYEISLTKPLTEMKGACEELDPFKMKNPRTLILLL